MLKADIKNVPPEKLQELLDLANDAQNAFWSFAHSPDGAMMRDVRSPTYARAAQAAAKVTVIVGDISSRWPAKDNQC